MPLANASSHRQYAGVAVRVSIGRATTASSLPVSMRYHIIGVGGIGMSAIAAFLHGHGYMVSGSDKKCSDMINYLRAMGISISVGDEPVDICAADYVVRSSAVMDNNPTVTLARSLGKPVVSRAEFLSRLLDGKRTVCISGSHGKTTVTTMVGSIMRCGGLDPTVICGGIISGHGSNIMLGNSEWRIVEADESDGTCAILPRDIALITNVCDEHAEYLGNLSAIKNLFERFVGGTSFFGFSVLCADDPGCASLELRSDRRVITYSAIADSCADFVAHDIHYGDGGMYFNIVTHSGVINDCFIPMVGLHNVLNATGAVALCSTLGVEDAGILEGLRTCYGAERRFTKIGEMRGVSIYDDYAHHPDEIVATLNAAKLVAGNDKKVAVIIQPHRFSRVMRYKDDFIAALTKANHAAVTDIYSAGESAVNFNVNINDLLIDNIILVRDARDATEFIFQNLGAGDVAVFMGAGDITCLARQVVHDFRCDWC